MDSKLHTAVMKRVGVTEFEEQFAKSFRKVFGIAPDIEDVTDNAFVEAHGESWALDGHNWLLWRDDEGEWVVATPELFRGRPVKDKPVVE